MITVGEVYTIKLTSGEELVAKVVRADSESVDVTSPVSVAPGPQGMGLVPSLFTADPSSNITINIHNISMHAPTDESVRVKYVEATTGLRVPEKKILMS